MRTASANNIFFCRRDVFFFFFFDEPPKPRALFLEAFPFQEGLKPTVLVPLHCHSFFPRLDQNQIHANTNKNHEGIIRSMT